MKDVHPSADEIAARSTPPTWPHIEPVPVVLGTCLQAPNFHCRIVENGDHHLHCNECHRWWALHREGTS